MLTFNETWTAKLSLPERNDLLRPELGRAYSSGGMVTSIDLHGPFSETFVEAARSAACAIARIRPASFRASPYSNTR